MPGDAGSGAGRGAMPGSSPHEARIDADVRGLLRRAEVRRAMAAVESSDAATLRDQVELAEVPAPPFGEGPRGDEFASRLRSLGLDEVEKDEVGNVRALLPGRSDDQTIALASHLDTVFPPGTDTRVRRDGRTLRGPGICDDARGLAAVLAVVRTLAHTGLRLRSHLTVLGTVGEEGAGDLRGVKHLFRAGAAPIDAFVSVDGSDVTRIVHMALGSIRYRISLLGPGGHSWSSFGLPNPVHALSRAVGLLESGWAAVASAARGDVSYNVGRIGGGTSVNSIPSKAWMEVEVRGGHEEDLAALERYLERSVRDALRGPTSVSLGASRVRVRMEVIGRRPCGSVAVDTPLVQRALAVSRAMGIRPVLSRSSTDANVPIARGVPAITVGGGGVSGRVHTLDEWFRNDSGPLGVQRVLALVVAQAGLAEE